MVIVNKKLHIESFKFIVVNGIILFQIINIDNLNIK
jgi:hypothetical protein